MRLLQRRLQCADSLPQVGLNRFRRVELTVRMFAYRAHLLHVSFLCCSNKAGIFGTQRSQHGVRHRQMCVSERTFGVFLCLDDRSSRLLAVTLSRTLDGTCLCLQLRNGSRLIGYELSALCFVSICDGFLCREQCGSLCLKLAPKRSNLAGMRVLTVVDLRMGLVQECGDLLLQLRYFFLQVLV